MQVILLETIQKLGSLGTLANVKAGYARNFLIPQGKVKPATKANLAEFETLKAGLEAKEAAALNDAKASFCFLLLALGQPEQEEDRKEQQHSQCFWRCCSFQSSSCSG